MPVDMYPDYASAIFFFFLRAQSKLESCVSEVAALDVKKLNLGEEITQLRNAMAVIDAKIPVLNEEKKSVVAARKFKEAARVQADIKQLTEEKCVPSSSPHAVLCCVCRAYCARFDRSARARREGM